MCLSSPDLADAPNDRLEARTQELRNELQEKQALLEGVTLQLKQLHEMLSTWEGFAKSPAASPH